VCAVPVLARSPQEMSLSLPVVELPFFMIDATSWLPFSLSPVGVPLRVATVSIHSRRGQGGDR